MSPVNEGWVYRTEAEVLVAMENIQTNRDYFLLVKTLAKYPTSRPWSRALEHFAMVVRDER